MANAFIQKEVTKIIEDKNYEFPLNLAMASAWVIANFKGINLKIFESKGSALCDYNVIASAQNTTQARAMIDEIQSALRQTGITTYSLEGANEAEWILLDLGDIIVHVFQENSRDIFDLDLLWKDFEQVQIPQEFYFSSIQDNTTNKKDDSPENYF